MIVPLVTVAYPRGIELKAQQVLAQFTRLPTTVDQANVSVPLPLSPVTLSTELESTAPLLIESEATALLVGLKLADDIVVTWLTVGVTAAGHVM